MQDRQANLLEAPPSSIPAIGQLGVLKSVSVEFSGESSNFKERSLANTEAIRTPPQPRLWNIVPLKFLVAKLSPKRPFEDCHPLGILLAQGLQPNIAVRQTAFKRLQYQRTHPKIRITENKELAAG